jgi:hypothetical protein
MIHGKGALIYPKGSFIISNFNKNKVINNLI